MLGLTVFALATLAAVYAVSYSETRRRDDW